MDNVPHSSEPLISKYNLNDDNSLLGNNKFLHDNVDQLSMKTSGMAYSARPVFYSIRSGCWW